jgi:hypothetical protein
MCRVVRSFGIVSLDKVLLAFLGVIVAFGLCRERFNYNPCLSVI